MNTLRCFHCGRAVKVENYSELVLCNRCLSMSQAELNRKFSQVMKALLKYEREAPAIELEV